MNDTPKLFEPFTLRGITLRNRIGVSPMCMYSAVDGVPQAWHLAHLGARAVGGAGLVIAEATGVLPEGRISPACTGLWNDAQAAAWAPITAFIKAQGAVAGIQLAHAGRKASDATPQSGLKGQLSDAQGGWQTVAPSALPYGGYEHPRTPNALDRDGIAHVRRAFVDAARRAQAAGFQWLELHAAHGYLMHQFLSPLSNTRTDDYGGSFQNRVRLLLETASDVRAQWPKDLPLAVRISATDWAEDGWDLEQSIELAKQLKQVGVDLIDVSSGGLSPAQQIKVGPGYQVGFASSIKADADIPTSAVGMISDPEQAESILMQEHADMILLGRGFLRDPHWAVNAAKSMGVPELCKLPVQYARA
jgi:2,4-dienoyl-CoA reductase-like NADH-dependent reductase (Old Yellow Enzyme family)